MHTTGQSHGLISQCVRAIDGLPACAPCIARCRAALSNETSAKFNRRRGVAVMNIALAMWGTVTVVIVVVRTVVRSWRDNAAAAKP
jgi:hypothetical protein